MKPLVIDSGASGHGRGDGSLWPQAVICDACEQLKHEVAALKQRLAGLSQNIPGIFYQIRRNLDGTSVEIPYISEGVREYLGYEPQEIVNDPQLLLQAIHPQDRPAYDSTIRQCMRELSLFQMEFRVISRNGQMRWLEATARGCRLENGFSLYTGIAVDVTERKRAQESLLQKTAELSALFQAIPDLYFRLDNTGVILSYQSGSISDLYLPPEKFLNRRMQDVLPHSIGEKFNIAIKSVNATRASASVVYVLPIKDEEKHFEARLVPLNSEIVVIVRDITQRELAEERLRSSEQFLQETVTALRAAEAKYRSIFENAVEGIFQTTPEGKYLSANPALARMYGYNSPRELMENLTDIGKGLYVLPGRREEFRKAVEEQDAASNFVSEIYRRDGSTIWVSENARAVRDASGKVLYYEGTTEDITERKRAEEALRKSEQKYRTLVENMNEGVVIVDSTGRIQFANDKFCDLLGYSRAELLARSETDLVLNDADREFLLEKSRSRSAGLKDQYEIALKTKSGKTVWVLVSGTPVHDDRGNVTGTMGIHTDITARKAIENQLAHDAFHDSLTGLPNRALLMDRLAQTLERQKRRPEMVFTVLFLDLDRFKVINDSLGHLAGDKLLVEISRRLQVAMRQEDTVARMGGDEFTVLVEDIKGHGELAQIAERVQKVISEPMNLQGNTVFTTASIGIAIGENRYNTAEQILRDADTAMYRAKSLGKARFEVFNGSMHTGVMAQLQLEVDLRFALERNELFLLYQPIVDFQSGRVSGFEALVRWQHSKIGLVSPTEFISLAEETGLIVPIGAWVLSEACSSAVKFQKAAAVNRPLHMNVNLSSKQLSQVRFVPAVEAILRETGVSPETVQLEITESVIMQNARTTTSLLEELKALKVNLAIDDFGTGYSSLSYLYSMPIDTLKIDRSFVRQMGAGQKKAEIVRAIATLAHNLEMRVVAEGIETAEQLAHLRELGCEMGQGFLFSRPLDEAAALELIRSDPRW
ncbi:MAG TPA: EAL domain-containing protein [Planctomycetota bacterium]|nr:EAL domain-containing protein [Planctomycetota bacterium]